MKKNMRMNLQRLAHWTFVLFAILVGNLCFAHAPDQGNVFLQIEGDSVKGRVEIALDDLNAALDLNMPSGDDVTIDDIRPWLAEIEAYVSERVALSIGTVSGPPPVTGYGIFDASFARLVQLEFAYENLPEVPSEIEVRYAALFDIQPNHRGMLVIETNWKTGTFQNESQVSGVFKPGEESIKLDLSDSTMFRGFASMVGLGTHHIWIGIDHILFLMALLLPAVVYRERSSWQPVDNFRTAFVHVIKVVTVFTIAHTITLSLAALNTVSLSGRLVESIIAISIAIAALHIIVPVFRGGLWWVVFAFGLFHGFGFASVLGEIGIPDAYLVHSLLGFNIGVELGQVAIVMVVFPVLYFVRRTPHYNRLFLPAAATALIVVSLYWFTERAFEVDLPAGAILNSILGRSA
jgi:hypothetical protein